MLTVNSSQNQKGGAAFSCSSPEKLYSDCELNVYTVRTVRMYGTAVRKYYRFYNGKSYSGASRSGVSGAIGTVETVKPDVERSLVHTGCGIDEFHLDSAVCVKCRYADESALRNVSEGVIEKQADAPSDLVFVSYGGEILRHVKIKGYTL